MAAHIKGESTLISEGKTDIYELRKELTYSDPGDSRIAIYSIGNPLPSYQESEFVVMVVGGTGVGKTTLINGIVNYVFGVEWKDKFRFKLITEEARRSQAHSQTRTIAAYIIHKHEGSRFPHKLIIVDTPGFGDPEGLERDGKISDDIKTFFSMRAPKGIDQIHAVAFVANAAIPRLTQTQQYIYETILTIFGRDIGSNFFLMCTFADKGKPAVLSAIEAAGISFQETFKFNNSALFLEDDDDDDDDDTMNSKFWLMGEKSYELFLQELRKVKPQSLQLTREVLDEREQLKTIMQGVQQDLQSILAKVNELEQEQTVVEEHKSQVEANKNFTYTVTEEQSKQVDIKGQGIFVTNCLQCNYTCHANCAYALDADKIKCIAMKNGSCKVCTRKCRWDLHKNNTFKYVTEKCTVKRTYAVLEKRYEAATIAGEKARQMVEKLKAEVTERYQEALSKIDEARQILNRLNEIALHPNRLSEVDYIDLLIENEKRQRRVDSMQRIARYQELREQAKLRARVDDLTIHQERALSQAAKFAKT